MNAIINDVTKRHDFVLLFDVTDGNPNGDPDAGNLPRVDPETMQGLVTDVCIKRKVRNYVDISGVRQGTDAYLRAEQRQSSERPTSRSIRSQKDQIHRHETRSREEVATVRTWMCEQFYDIRMFGAVMTTEKNCGQVRGPLQLTFARSINPIIPLDLSITRVAVTKPQDLEVEKAKKRAEAKLRKWAERRWFRMAFTKPMVSLRLHLPKAPCAAASDLEIFWPALQNMWDIDHSASAGNDGLPWHLHLQP